jgi:stage V sporulation protein B
MSTQYGGSPRQRLMPSRTSSTMLATVTTNVTVIVVSLGASVIVARELGADGRGTFATLFAAFSLALVLADIGQSSSITFFTAREPDRRAEWVSDGRRIMVVGGLVVTVVGVVLTGPLGVNASISSFDLALVISACVINGLAAPSVFALQALSIPAWNALRLIQPVVYTVLVAMFFAIGELSIRLLAVLLMVSVAVSLLSAVLIGRRFGLIRVATDRKRSATMLRYGAAAYASGLPVTVAQNGDRFVIIAILSASDVGRYAVSVSVMSLTAPIAVAIASIQFPRLASLRGDADTTRALIKRTLQLSALTVIPASIGIAAAGQWLVPAVFGPDFAGARWLLWALVPIGILRSVSVVTSGLLRGLGRPGVPAVAQTASLVLLAVSIVPACIIGGLAGLIGAVTAAELLALALCLPALRQARASVP